jgi:methylated-DNA-protein-cysteine methyltransferase-like protein
MGASDRPEPAVLLTLARVASPDELPDETPLSQRILAAVEAIPPGRVMSYGDVAEYVGTRAARNVGRVLALDGGTVPWHRVLRSNGTMAEHLVVEQTQRLRAEGVRVERDRVAMDEFRWDGA